MENLQIKRILVPADLSEKSILSLQYARFFAERFSSAVTLLHVEPTDFGVSEPGAGLPLYINSTADYIAALQKEIRAYADEVFLGMPYEVVIVVGQAAPAIVAEEEEREADLVVMATHSLHGWRRLILGSVTEGVLRGSDCPVLSVSRTQRRLTTSDPVKKVLCPINFTETARASLEYASGLTAALEGELVVVHVAESEDRMRAVAGEIDVRAWIDPAVQNRCSYREIILRGGPAERVLDCAEDLGADLIVIGAQHKRFHDETVIGTTTERLVRSAQVPVLTVPRGAEVEEPAYVDTLMSHAG